ncbi:MAG TPA: hypothetical protein VH044_08730 [Polyangiaceae bacterium]|jgi:hypothetical protein|nr:hypothetical protein [Polyangiaceae bacterium]
MPSDPLARALDEAIAGRRAALFELLARGSRLPGPRPNGALADSFAQACRSRGAPADAVALMLTSLDADEAPGATKLEFLPLCGVLALAARAAAEPKVRTRYVAELHARADDLRFRVREAVIEGLARIGGADPDALVDSVASWMDGYFHAAAVVRAVALDPWLPALGKPEAVLQRLDEGFLLLRDAPRSAARYPGHKALLEALEESPQRLALRFGVPVFDLMTRWATVKDPVLRELVANAMAEGKLAGRFRPELERVRQALVATEPAPRNPDHDFGPSRDRSGARKRGRR